ncbi:puratrophin-1-like [Lampetra planeri]
MDAIRECDVNLKEQGQLLRQEEFVVWHGRKKMQRRVFLFQELVLFSKTKRAEGVQDVYAYKSSFKTAELGLTESVGEEGLRFEIWFRRRKSSDAFVLQAPTPELKLAWTRDVSRILWQQATRNRQVRMQELSCMGMGGKPYMDIRPSAAAISDRAIEFFTRGRGTRSRASIAVSSFDHSGQTSPHRSAFLSPAGGLNSHGGLYSCVGPAGGGGPLLSPGRMAAANSEFQSCIQEEEDATEPDTGSQPSVATASTDSLSQCTSSGSGDSGCSSRFPYDASAEEGSAPPPLARAPLGPFPGRGLRPAGAPPSPASSGDESRGLAAGRGPRCRPMHASGASEGGARYGPRGDRAEGTRWQEDDASRRNGDKKGGGGFPCSPSTPL